MTDTEYIGGIMPSDMRIIYKPIDELVPYKRNPRKNDEASEKLSKLIENRKFRIPILIDGKGTIIAGHTRLKALRRLNYEGTVACIMIEDMTDEEIRAFRLEDNRSQEWSEWDDILLDEEIGELEDLGIEPMGFVRNEPMEIEDIEEDEPPEPPAEAETKPGDMYVLGDHRLLCGDSTSTEAMDRLMQDEEADLIVTDPPYNVDYSSKNETLNKVYKGNRQQSSIENDNLDAESFREFLTDAFCAMYGALRRGGAYYVWHADGSRRQFQDALEVNNMMIRQVLIWSKNHIVLGRQDYQYKHEPCIYGWKEGQAHYFIDDRTKTTIYENPPDIDSMSKEDMRKLLQEILANVETTILHENKPAKSELHPTMKPVKLIAHQIVNSSRPGEIVLDPFGGSGSTMIACEHTGRKCRMMELDPHYCDVIVQRWEALTGRKAEKVGVC